MSCVFCINSHYDVVFATQYNHRLNSLAVFWYVRKICLGVKNICLPFVTCIKQTRYSTIGCTTTCICLQYNKLLNLLKPLKNKIGFQYKLYFSLNSHCDVVFATKYNHRLNSLAVFQCVRKTCRGVKNICLCFAVCTKLTRNPTSESGIFYFIPGVVFSANCLTKSDAYPIISLTGF